MELVVFCGLQASGKSSFFKERLQETHEHVSKDLLGKSNRDSKQHQLIMNHLSRGKSVVVDNCNVSRKDRERLVDLAKTYGASPVCYVFRSDPADCLRRNEAREGKKKIPLVAFWRFRREYQAPSWNEGWASMYDVELVEGRGFLLQERSSASQTAPNGVR